MTLSDKIIAQLTPDEAGQRDEAVKFDAEDPLRHLRNEFIFPTKGDLHSKTINNKHTQQATSSDAIDSIYLCGNSLGLQPKLVGQRVAEHLSNWGQKGVNGHWSKAEDATLEKWTDADDAPNRILSNMVGAKVDANEVVAMESLTVNLHLLLASFYRPTSERWKIIMEGKAFPSDHYALESQLRHHGYSPRDGLVTIFPEPPAQVLTTQQIISVIDEHASSTALVLLPGIQYYTGQFLDIPTITAHAHSKGIVIGWDLAHAAGNVPLQLHDWDVDFAVWCHYKYINAGPGAIGGAFIHSRHTKVDLDALTRGDLDAAYRPRLSGWWGYDKSTRFNMNTIPDGDSATAFVPRPGAAGFQVGNTCILALAALQGTLEVFDKTSMADIRRKSEKATKFLESLLDWHAEHFWDGDTAGKEQAGGQSPPYWIITPRDPAQRGAMLSVQLREGILDAVMDGLDKHGVIVDERKPDVVRVAPAPLFNSFLDCWTFAYVFAEVCKGALRTGYTPRLDE